MLFKNLRQLLNLIATLSTVTHIHSQFIWWENLTCSFHFASLLIYWLPSTRCTFTITINILKTERVFHFTYSEFQYKPLQRVKANVIARLARHCPDRQLVDYVVDGFRNGFRLGMEKRPLPRGPRENLAKVLEDPEGA